jgi:putative heme degradation protein
MFPSQLYLYAPRNCVFSAIDRLVKSFRVEEAVQVEAVKAVQVEEAVQVEAVKAVLRR